jgi:predicted molibdopterin-dependent oxidoreductase YjgC
MAAKITIDGEELEVPDGTTVLQAARANDEAKESKAKEMTGGNWLNS